MTDDIDAKLDQLAVQMRADADQSIALLVETTNVAPQMIEMALALWQEIHSRLDDGSMAVEGKSLLGVLARLITIGASAVADSVQSSKEKP